jgi:hypothetical protein
MMAAADAVILDLTVIERGAAMAAAGVQQAGAAAAVAKQHEILAENAHFLGTSLASEVSPTGCQWGRKSSPIGVPRPTW